MVIFGAGMAGLLAAQVLRRFNPVVHEKQLELPNNHAALLRFRSDVVSQLTGIPFRKVSVSKAVVWKGELRGTATVAMNNQYSFKVTGKIVERSILNLNGGDRWIAPPDFIAQLARGVKIEYDSGLDGGVLFGRSNDSDPAISTIPMPALMDVVGFDKPDFAWRKVWSVTATLVDCDVFQTLYYPEGHTPWYRASITGDKLTVEYLREPEFPQADVVDVLVDFGVTGQAPLASVKSQTFGKLAPLADPEAARHFILMMTDRYRIYSLGRFATWRQILLDDVAHDIKMIERLVDYRDAYNRALQSIGEF